MKSRCRVRGRGRGHRPPPKKGRKAHDDEEANKQGLVKGDRVPVKSG